MTHSVGAPENPNILLSPSYLPSVLTCYPGPVTSQGGGGPVGGGGQAGRPLGLGAGRGLGALGRSEAPADRQLLPGQARHHLGQRRRRHRLDAARAAHLQ